MPRCGRRATTHTTNAEIRNQYPEVWDELQRLRAGGAVTCDAEYQQVMARVSPALFFFYKPSTQVDFHSNNEVYCQIAGGDGDMVVGGDMASVDFRKRLRDIKAPALVLASRFDRVAIPYYSAQFQHLMPQAEFHWFEHSGHFPFIEEPSLHHEIVRTFLRR